MKIHDDHDDGKTSRASVKVGYLTLLYFNRTDPRSACQLSEALADKHLWEFATYSSYQQGQ